MASRLNSSATLVAMVTVGDDYRLVSHDLLDSRDRPRVR